MPSRQMLHRRELRGSTHLLRVEQVVVQGLLLPDHGLGLVGRGVRKPVDGSGLAAEEAVQVRT